MIRWFVALWFAEEYWMNNQRPPNKQMLFCVGNFLNRHEHENARLEVKNINTNDVSKLNLFYWRGGGTMTQVHFRWTNANDLSFKQPSFCLMGRKSCGTAPFSTEGQLCTPWGSFRIVSLVPAASIGIPLETTFLVVGSVQTISSSVRRRRRHHRVGIAIALHFEKNLKWTTWI